MSKTYKSPYKEVGLSSGKARGTKPKYTPEKDFFFDRKKGSVKKARETRVEGLR